VDPQRLVQRSVERGAVITELLAEPLLRLGLDKVGRWRAGVSLLRMRHRPSERRRGPVAVRWAPQCCADVARATSAPAEASGADTGGLAHWSQPSGGTSSSGISTTTALGLPAAAGAGEVGGATAATPVIAAVTGAACCGSTAVAGCRGSATAAACCASAATRSGSVASAAPRESPLAAVAVLAAAHDALDERRLVGTAASDLSTLAGARGGTVGATLRTRR
jgi:hypothetical protein